MLSTKIYGLRSNKGFSLLEVMLAIGVAAIVFTGLLVLLMSVVAMNRVTSMEVAGITAARNQAEEIFSLATSANMKSAMKGGGDADVPSPMLLIAFLTSGSLPSDYIVDRIGNPPTKIVCKFPVSDPGYAPRDKDGKRVAGTTATGVMTVYLDESMVPLLPNGTTPGSLWSDLSFGSSAKGVVGFDMNADGKIHNGGLLDSDLRFTASDISASYKRITQLPVDFRVELMERNGRLAYLTDYRVIVSDRGAKKADSKE